MQHTMKKTLPKQKEIERGTGTFLNEHDDRDIFVDEFIPTVSSSVLPVEFLPDQSHLTVYDQGKLGTCVAHQIATEKQDQEYREINKKMDFSRRYIYSLTRKQIGLPDSNEGLYPRSADKMLVSKGIAPEKDLPETAKTHAEYVAIDIPASTILNAFKYRVADNFAFVAVNEAAIKQALINFKGVGCSMPYGAWWKMKRGVDVLGTPDAEKITGWHRIRLNGYRTVKGRLQLRFQNSHGKDFGKKGLAFFDFEAFRPFIRDLSVYTDVPSTLLEQVKELPYAFNLDLRRGMSGYDVLQLQKRLAKEGLFGFEPDGNFGPRTERAVKDYQTKYKITPVSGYVGPKTRAKLNGTTVLPELKMTLVDALIKVESNGNLYAIGDLNLKHKAYGPLQIRQPYCDDVNRAFGTKHKAEDMLGNKELSVWVYTKYMELYATEANIGGPVTDEHRARIHNGGPSGFKRASTLEYWNKVKSFL